MKYNQVYGKHSLGTGSWMEDDMFELGAKEPYNNKIIKSYITQVAQDLDRIAIKDKLKNINTMDVGTGRQALALYELGAKKVDHYDISQTNVKNFTKYLKENNIPINSYQSDICDINFNNDVTYDFIYLQGIIQHVRSPYNAIENLSKACNKNAILWFYNYQAGPLVQLYVEILRNILPLSCLNLKSLSEQLLSLGLTFKEVDVLLDDCGCTYRHLIKNEIYNEALNKFGFERFFTKDVTDQSEGLDLSTYRDACISGFIKKKSINKKYKVSKKDFEHVDHFDPKNFQTDQKDFIIKIGNIKNDIMRYVTGKEQEILVEATYPFFEEIVRINNKNSLKMNQDICKEKFSIVLKNLR